MRPLLSIASAHSRPASAASSALRRAVLVGRRALLEDQVAAGVGGDQRDDEEQHHHDDQRGRAALPAMRRAGGRAGTVKMSPFGSGRTSRGVGGVVEQRPIVAQPNDAATGCVPLSWSLVERPLMSTTIRAPARSASIGACRRRSASGRAMRHRGLVARRDVEVGDLHRVVVGQRLPTARQTELIERTAIETEPEAVRSGRIGGA